jgi:hypothetical protein
LFLFLFDQVRKQAAPPPAAALVFIYSNWNLKYKMMSTTDIRKLLSVLLAIVGVDR